MYKPPKENPPLEELPAELPVPEVAEIIVTLPEPPVEVEASGSGQPEDLPQPTAAAEEPAEEVPPEKIGSEDASDDGLEVAIEEVEAAVVEEENTVANPGEEQPNILEVSTASSGTIEEEEKEVEKEGEKGLPAHVPPPEHMDVASESSETDLLPAGHDSAEDNSEHSDPSDGDTEPAAEEPRSDVGAQPPVAPLLEEVAVDETAEVIGQEVDEEVVSEAPQLEEKVSEAPQISTDDLTEDEILLVNQDLPEPLATEYLSPEPPTALSPEKESPFTRIADVSAAATEGHPRIVITPLVEVRNTQSRFEEIDRGHGTQSFRRPLQMIQCSFQAVDLLLVLIKFIVF